MSKAKYFIESTEVTQTECLEYFILHSGFTRDDAVNEFLDNNNPDSCDYINELCTEVEVFYE